MDHPEEFTRLLMEVADRAYLTTQAEDGYPHARAVLNLRNPTDYPHLAELFDAHRDDLLIYMTTNTASAKLRQIRGNPRGSVYYSHPKKFQGVLLVGDLEIVDDSSLRRALWSKGWEVYYPGGPDDSDHTVLRMLPKYANGWNGSERFEFPVPLQ
jgi:general stress protein 26